MDRPDVIWFLSDELRTDAIGVYGNRWTEMRTPNIDRLARLGTRFENCFCNSPVCVPSRLSMLTGLHCVDTGVFNNEAVRPEAAPKGLGSLVTIPQVFADAGYRVANFGKVHLPHGMQPWAHHDPRGAAITDLIGRDQALAEIIYARTASEGIVRAAGPGTIHAGTYPATVPYPAQAVTDNALAWLHQAQSPVFVRLSYLQPHTPVLPPEPFASLYPNEAFDDAADEASLSQFEEWFGRMQHPGGGLTREEVRRTRAHYYGLVAWLDAQVGRVLDWLEETGRLGNAILVFGADHGASLGEGMRYGKQTFAPEVQRVPLLIAAPGRVAADQHRADLCENLDLGRTLFSLAGLDAPGQFRGRDLFQDPPPKAVFSVIGYGEPESLAFPLGRFGRYLGDTGWPRRACVRTERYRLDMTVRHEGRPVDPHRQDLFVADVQADPLEMHNLARSPLGANTVANLTGLLEAHLANAVEGHAVP